MNHHPSQNEMVEVFTILSEDEANLCLLILSASNIDYEVNKTPDGWMIRVTETDCAKAVTAVKAYFRENPLYTCDSQKTAVPSEKLPTSFLGIWMAAVLMVFYIAVTLHGVQTVLVAEFGSSAQAIIMQGEWYRTVTALMLHRDVLHLAGNLVAIAVFASFVASEIGSGIGGLLILLAGMTGNLLNALLYQVNHVSIGASTAVFGAIGILTGLSFGQRMIHPERKVRAWLPLSSGLCLLAFFGSDGDTDLMAHLFGFAGGILPGVLYSVCRRSPLSANIQYVCMAAALVVTIMAWLKLF